MVETSRWSPSGAAATDAITAGAPIGVAAPDAASIKASWEVA